MLYFIRHAQSLFNYDTDELEKAMGEKYSKKSPEYLSLKFDEQYLDCGLTQKGKQECLQARQKAHALDIKLVLVSPMRRALQTCDIIFKDHPNKPAIVVDPGVRQIFTSSCDIGSSLRQGMKQFPYFDFSQIKDPDVWYIDSIKNEKVKGNLLQKFQQTLKNLSVETNLGIEEVRQKAGIKTMLTYIKQVFGTTDQFYLGDFEAQKQKLKQVAKKFVHVAVVSHHDNIITYTKKPTENCEIMPFKAEDL